MSNLNEDYRTRTFAKLERLARDGSLRTPPPETRYSTRFLVRVTSVRKRLLDEDNLCEKYHVDCCRYAGLIPSDAPQQTHIEVFQRKAAKDEEEYVEIEIIPLHPYA